MSQVKPIEQIKTGNVNVKTGEEEDEIYDSIYMKIVELVEKDNISCGFYKDTANKLKDLYVIEKRSEQQDTPDQSSQIKLLQEQIRKQEEETKKFSDLLVRLHARFMLYSPLYAKDREVLKAVKEALNQK